MPSIKYSVSGSSSTGCPPTSPADAHGLVLISTAPTSTTTPTRARVFHPDWKSCISTILQRGAFLPHFQRPFWLEHITTSTACASSMPCFHVLSLDYSREEGEWIPNEFGGNENTGAISFLKNSTKPFIKEFPDAITIAEESTAWTAFPAPPSPGGLGFTRKWMMGWMHDTLSYFKHDPSTGSTTTTRSPSAWCTPPSAKIYAACRTTRWYTARAPHPAHAGRRMAALRQPAPALRLYVHPPGHPTALHGGEFYQTSEWNIEKAWNGGLPNSNTTAACNQWIKALNHFYRSSPALSRNSSARRIPVDRPRRLPEQQPLYLRYGNDQEKPSQSSVTPPPVVREKMGRTLPPAGGILEGGAHQRWRSRRRQRHCAK